MWKTILRRVLFMIPQILILSVLIFILAKMMPGDPFSGLIQPGTDPAQIEMLREKAGLYDPWYVQYFRWLGNAVHGDFGASYQYKIPVANLISERAMNTVWLSLLTVILTYAIALPLGILSGRYQNSKLDKTVVVYNFFCFAIPSFVFALMMLFVFGYRLGWFPTLGSVSPDVEPGSAAYLWSRFYHLILPAITSALLATAVTIQYLRSEVIDLKSSDFVRTARSKGVSTNKIFTQHIFRNASLPIAAMAGYEITGLLGGSVVIERIFGFPGMGNLFVTSIVQRDYSVVTALILIYGLATLFGALISDIIMSAVDPRIRVQ
jgi:peptide/nickel transport system permease protein